MKKTDCRLLLYKKGGPCLEGADRRRRQEREDMCTVSGKACLAAEAQNFEHGGKIISGGYEI